MIAVVMLCSQCLISVEARSIVERQNLLANGPGMTPSMGYIHVNFSDHKIFKSSWNTWNHFYCDINETIIRESGTNILMSDALVSTGLAKLGYRYRVNMMNCLWHGHVDDCWVEHDRDATVCKWADYVHGKGIKLACDTGEEVRERTDSRRAPPCLQDVPVDMYFKSSWNTWNHFYCDINETIIRESGTNISSANTRPRKYLG
ncbi:unnamed protein product [Musa acuminata subsp. burmannicoides]